MDCGGRLRDHGVSTSVEMSYYLNTVQTLLSSPTNDEYTTNLISIMSTWSQPFSQYFTTTVHPLMSHIGTWQLAQ